MKHKLFSSILIAFVVSLALICVYYGTSFAPGLRRHHHHHRERISYAYESDDEDDFFGNGAESYSGELATVKSFPVCHMRFSELIPCLDRNLTYQLKLKFNLSLMEHYERHCPPPERRYNCLIPPPVGYKVPIRWPASRDEVWKANIPHTHLAYVKSDQKWMVVNGQKINFPGGGTHFHDGADKYIVSLAKMLKFSDDSLNNGGNIRNVLDVGCGVASFGAYLLHHHIIAMSLAPNDAHENQIQFALERGIPATLGVLGTKRLPYPSRSFELAHCSRCRINWLQRDGILLLELDRLLRPGGYFVLSSPEAYAQDEENRRMWTEMNDLFKRMCWKLASRKNQTAIWMKPSTGACYTRRAPGTLPPFCDPNENPDAAWGVPMKACISSYSKRISKDKTNGLAPWPQRLIVASPRLEDLGITRDKYVQDTKIWNFRVIRYWKKMKSLIEKNSFRNVMDMNANLGGFAAALADKDVWVMNVVPVNESDKLKIIYDRGLIGTIHNWCESFSTYPRTYDLIHAWLIFSEIEKSGCGVEDLLIEIDRLLRPLGFVIIRDKQSITDYVRKFLKPLKWDSWYTEVEPNSDAISSGPERVLIARKKMWKDGPKIIL